MNTFVKTDSYSSALSIVDNQMTISIIDDNTAKKADLNRVKISKILDKNFVYRISAIKKILSDINVMNFLTTFVKKLYKSINSFNYFIFFKKI